MYFSEHRVLFYCYYMKPVFRFCRTNTSECWVAYLVVRYMFYMTPVELTEPALRGNVLAFYNTSKFSCLAKLDVVG